MKLKTLTLSNYRGFEQLDLEFCDDVTVIAGVNGSGKSGILRAIAGLGSYLAPEISPAKRDVIPFDDDDIHHGKQAFTISTKLQGRIVETTAQMVRAMPDPKKAPAIQKKIEEIRTKRRNLEKDSKEDKDAGARIDYFGHLLTDSTDEFRHQQGEIEGAGELDETSELLMVFYPTNRVFGGLPPRLAGVKAASPADAYSKALNEVRISLNEIANWYRAVQDGLIGSKEFGKSLVAMMEATIDTILPGFSGLALESTPRPHFTIKKEGKRFNLDQLSDGEKALLALAFDLTRRLTIANPKSKKPVYEGKALVMVDEIELHLHPNWQRQVLRRLSEAFPNCQFIVTTHSALVLGEIQSECVRFLEPNEETGRIEAYIPPESFGLDANRVLDELMGASERNKQVLKDLTDLFRLIDKEKFDEARAAMTPLAKMLGEDEPELTRANALIRFLEGKE